jgi:hypothetical protein
MKIYYIMARKTRHAKKRSNARKSRKQRIRKQRGGNDECLEIMKKGLCALFIDGTVRHNKNPDFNNLIDEILLKKEQHQDEKSSFEKMRKSIDKCKSKGVNLKPQFEKLMRQPDGLTHSFLKSELNDSNDSNPETLNVTLKLPATVGFFTSKPADYNKVIATFYPIDYKPPNYQQEENM